MFTAQSGSGTVNRSYSCQQTPAFRITLKLQGAKRPVTVAARLQTCCFNLDLSVSILSFLPCSCCWCTRPAETCSFCARSQRSLEGQK